MRVSKLTKARAHIGSHIAIIKDSIYGTVIARIEAFLFTIGGATLRAMMLLRRVTLLLRLETWYRMLKDHQRHD